MIDCKLLIVFVATVFLVRGAPTEELSRGNYPRIIQFPDGDGKLHDVDLEAQPDVALLAEIERNPANNLYLLFTRRNPTEPQTLVINDPTSLRKSNFNRNRPTVVIVHGWLSNQNTGLNPTIRDAVLKNYDANVIVMDWRRLALSNYVTAVRGVPLVGRGLGQFLTFLHNHGGLLYHTLHLVGFSLGAHVVGNAGREIGGKAARVTGLDPAGPLWNLNSNRISPSDGVYVEAIHTDGATIGLGIGSNVADVDFYVNGGSDQPGCLTSICDHNRAWELFAASVAYDHLVGRQCSNKLQISLNTCRGSGLNLGNNNIRKIGLGMFRVNTKRRYPY